jgi:hypothetical protein
MVAARKRINLEMGPFSARLCVANRSSLTHRKSLCARVYTEKRSIVVNGADIMSRFISAAVIFFQAAAVRSAFSGGLGAAARSIRMRAA